MSDPLIWDEGREAIGQLPGLMRAIGHEEWIPHEFGGPNRTKTCPFCKERGKFGLFNRDGRIFFKCQRTSCEACEPVAGHAEIGYLALARGLSVKDACVAFLDLALPGRAVDRAAPSRVSSAGDEENARGATRSTFRNPARDLDAKSPWQALFKKLILSAGDAERETRRRGLAPETLELMGLCSNTSANKLLVEGLPANGWPEQELVALGILKSKDGRVRAAGQLTGWGRTGWFNCACGKYFKARRCPKCDRKPEDEDAEWQQDGGRFGPENRLTFLGPPLIPYYDFAGAVMYLRPHKGGVSNAEQKAIEKLDLPDEDDPSERCAAHVYVPPGFAELLEANDGRAVFTEGEYKVGALMQCGLAALACPGITFIRNAAFRAELVRALRYYRVRELIVIFDNENKSDPALPDRYQPDPNRQHDTQIWAEFTLLDLRPEMRAHGGAIRLGRLPDEERVEGKADFDGVLGRYVREAEGDQRPTPNAQRPTSKEEATPISERALKEGTKAARKIFLKAIREAVDDPASEKELFPGAVRRIIDRRLHLMRHCKRRLKFGDNAERELAKRLAEWDPFDLMGDPDNPRPAPVDRGMAEAFREVHGCYYGLKAKEISKDERERIVDALLPAVEGKIKAAREAKKYDHLRLLYAYRRSYYARLKGKPVAVGTCVLRGRFRLRTSSGIVYLVQAYDHRDTRRSRKAPLLTITADDLAQPGDFKNWMIKHGHNTSFGVTELDALRDDLLDETYLREIHRVTYCGHHEDIGIWFGEDGAFMDDKANKEGFAVVMRPDENGVIWNPADGIGYKLDQDEKQGEEEAANKRFSCGLPRLFAPRPSGDDSRARTFFSAGTTGCDVVNYIAGHFLADETKPVRDLALAMQRGERQPSLEDLLGAAGPEKISAPDFTVPPNAVTGRPMLTEQTVHSALETAVARGIFKHLRDDLPVIIGDLDAWMALGVMFGYAIGPALVAYRYCHPGLFSTGDLSSGKSETVRRFQALWGMPINKSFMLGKTTGVGLTRLLANYSSVPIHADEYRKILGKEKGIDDALRAATERNAGVKGNITSDTSTTSLPPRTSPVCSGQNSPSDSATASRYVHLTFSEKRRQPGSAEAWDRFCAETPHFYHLGRWLMMRRAAFERRAMEELRAWMSDQAIHAQFAAGATQGKDRVMVATGVAFACFVTMAEMLGLPLEADRRAAFRAFAIKHGARTLTEVSEETFRHQFWRDVITGLNTPTSHIKRMWFETGRHVTLKFATGVTPAEAAYSTKDLRTALTAERPLRLMTTTTRRHPNAAPVLYVAIHEIYAAWERDLRSKGHETPISFQNLRSESEREEYLIPTSKADRNLDHWQVFKIEGNEESETPKKASWCISLERRTNKDGTPGDFIFEYAPALLRAVGKMVEDEEPEAAE